MSSRDWESTFSGWTGAEGTVEEAKAQRTLTGIRDALRASASLAPVSVEVYPKGSYPNRTNVVRDSDIDVAVELTSIIYNEFVHDARGLGVSDVGLTPYTGPYVRASFKDHIEAALVAAFGRAQVARGNLAITVAASSTTLPVDVVPCQTVLVHSSRTSSRRGIIIWPDRGQSVINYPKQHLDEGVKKNERCNRRYKRTVRILKRLENEMVAKRVIEVVPSFLIESMVWNVSNATLIGPTNWNSVVRNTIAEAYHQTKSDEAAEELTEANAIKYLFHASQKWTRQQGNDFLRAAYDYVGYS